MRKLIVVLVIIILMAGNVQAGPLVSGGGGGGGSIATDTIWDAAGDLVYGSAANTGARLAHPGAANYFLYSNAATTIAWLSGANLTALAGLTPTANRVIGYPSGSTTLSLLSSLQLDDSQAQFYSATASKGTFKLLMTSMGDGILGTFTPVCTGACTLTTESYGEGIYTLVDKTTAQTLTNKTLTTPVITSLEVLIDCSGAAAPYAYCTSANASTLTATQTSRTVINSYGRGEAQTVTLPAAATGMTFIAMVGTQHNSAWKIQRAGADTITWSAAGTDTVGKTYFQETNQAVGSRVSCITYQSGAATWSWLCGSVTGTWVTD